VKIEQVRSIVLGDLHFVKIATDSGLVGVGQSACWAYPNAVSSIVDSFRPYLVGQDPMRTEHIWQRLYRMGPFRGSVLMGAVSSIDIALWDIKGKHYRAPVWELLGGRYRDRVRLCLMLSDGSVDELVDGARTALREGFTAIKFFALPAGYQDMSQAALIKTTCEKVNAVRDAVGPEADIILELGRRLTPPQAISLIEALVPVRPLFFEDPIQIDSISSQAEIARRVNAPLAYGERLHSIWEFRELLAQGGTQYVRPDLGLAGGFSQCKKIAAVAESYHAIVATHNYFGPLLTAASIHLDVCSPNVAVQEYLIRDESPIHGAINSTLRREGGFMCVPESPGLGVEFDETHAPPEAYRDYMGGFIYKTPIRLDGSVALSV